MNQSTNHSLATFTDGGIKEFTQSAQPKKGICILAGCGGRIIRKVTGVNDLGLVINPPECEECGQVHIFGDDAPLVGEEKFLAMMEQTDIF